MNYHLQDDATVRDSLSTRSASCPVCLGPLDPQARSSRVILTTLGVRRFYHLRCLQRVARLPGPFPRKAA